MSELVVLLDGTEVGVVRQRAGRLTFDYDEAWRSSPGAYSLSLSLPLASARHSHAAVNAFLWGLLPDNERVLETWGRQFHVSARNPFALLGAVGEDCAGAVQLVQRGRLAELQRAGPPDVDWLSHADVAARLRVLRDDVTAWRSSADEGQFSLAGAQPKTALYVERGRFGVPRGRTPTTHILKPALPAMDGHAENEHLCLLLARSLGLPTASARVQKFDDVTAIVVERYDRVRVDGVVRRVHQEDLCQALGYPPTKKYENEGGPSAADIVQLLRAAVVGTSDDGAGKSAADTDVWTFLDALILNWFLGGTDAHAKNYSLLLGPVQIRLAPLYDVASIFAYPSLNPRKAKMAMKVGGRYRLDEIGIRTWGDFAKELRVDADTLVERVRVLGRQIPDYLTTECRHLRSSGVDHPVLARIEREVTGRVGRLVRSA